MDGPSMNRSSTEPNFRESVGNTRRSALKLRPGVPGCRPLATSRGDRTRSRVLAEGKRAGPTGPTAYSRRRGQVKGTVRYAMKASAHVWQVSGMKSGMFGSTAVQYTAKTPVIRSAPDGTWTIQAAIATCTIS